MSERAAAERACKEPNPVIDGRKANVNLAYLGAKPRGIQTRESPSASGRRAVFYGLQFVFTVLYLRGFRVATSIIAWQDRTARLVYC